MPSAGNFHNSRANLVSESYNRGVADLSSPAEQHEISNSSEPLSLNSFNAPRRGMTTSSLDEAVQLRRKRTFLRNRPYLSRPQTCLTEQVFLHYEKMNLELCRPAEVPASSLGYIMDKCIVKLAQLSNGIALGSIEVELRSSCDDPDVQIESKPLTASPQARE